MYKPGRPAAADEHLVRPYMLGDDGPLPPERSDPWPPPRGDQYDDQLSPRLLGDATEAGWPANGARRDRARPEPDSALPPARHRAPRSGSLAGWSAALRRRPGPATIAAVAGIIAIAGALIGLLPASRSGRCPGGRACHAAAAGLPSLSPGSPTASARGPAAPARPSARPSLTSPATSAPATSAPPTAAPELTPTQPATTTPPPATLTPPGAGVTVSYKLLRFWHDGFEGEFTIMNGSTAPLDDWQLAMLLPGDRVLVAWNARFTATGATVVLTPRSHQAVIEPGVSLSEHFIAGGTQVRPQSCTLNGVPCS